MKAAIRIFALSVAFTGLISACFSAPPSRAIPHLMSSAVSDPGPLIPLPCPGGQNGTCTAAPQSNQ